MNAATQDSLSPIQMIRNLAENSNDCLLDRSPVYENEIFEILWMLTGTNPNEKMYADVPIWAIGSFTHLNFAYPGTSWRKLLYPSVDGKKDGVTGRGWTKGVFDYFAGPLEENWFPAQASMHELRLHAYGNFVSVTCGVHRAVGAINFLASTQGSETAVLNQAKLTYQEIDQELLDFLESRMGDKIYLSWVQHGECAGGIRIMAANKYGATIFRYRNRLISTDRKWTPLPHWALRHLTETALFCNWHYVANEHLYILLQPKWLPVANSRLRNTSN